MTIRCPDCGRIHDVDGKQGGDQLTCDCGRLLTVPSAAGGDRLRSGIEGPPPTPPVPPPPAIRPASPLPPPPPRQGQPAAAASQEPEAEPVDLFSADPSVGFPEPPDPGLEPESAELSPYGAEPPPPEEEAVSPVAEASPGHDDVQWGPGAGAFEPAASTDQYVAPGTTWEFRGVPLLGQGPITGKPPKGAYQRRAPQPGPRAEPVKSEARDLRGTPRA